jgi:membrane fusion protein, copper/silver efflux system
VARARALKLVPLRDPETEGKLNKHSKHQVAFACLLALLVAAAAFGGYRYALHRSMQAAAPTPSSVSGGGKPVLYWYDPMYPQHRFDKPGKSPFMDMQLVPKYAAEGDSDPGTVSISPRMVQNLGVRVTEAKAGSLESRIEVVGSVAYNERGVVQLQARASGFVERVHARAPLDRVQKGAAMVDILYPEWATAQAEYLVLRKAGAPDLQRLAPAARQRLRLSGMRETEIEEVEREGRTQPLVTLRAPISGVIAELGVREGMTVAPGSMLYKLVDLSTVWVHAEVPEAMASSARPGIAAEVRVTAYPDAVFKGKVGALLPEVNATTRTLRARIELPDPGERLKPGMFATVTFPAAPGKEAVLVPSEAVIRTGQRDVVVVALGEGKFRAVPVQVGAEAGAQSEIRSGLRPGEKVVVSGQFLIDSEASFSAALARLEGTQEKPETVAQQHKGRGRVLAVDPARGRVELDHEPIASMQWPRMTMGFVVEDRTQLARLKKGDAVEFELRAKPDADGNYVISRIGGKP